MADDDGKNEKTYSQEYVQRLNNEAAATRKQLEEIQGRLKSYDDEKAARDEEEAKKRGEYERLLTEAKAEREKERRSEAQKIAAARKAVLENAVKAHLADLADPDFVKLFDTKGIEVDPETYAISGLSEAIAAFREAKPHLFKEGGTPQGNDGSPAPKKAGASPGGGGNGSGGTKFFDAMNATPEQINEYLSANGISI